MRHQEQDNPQLRGSISIPQSAADTLLPSAGANIGYLTLPDETVLLQMGAVPPDLKAQEAQAYRDGLRQVIQNIRERKVKDCSAVASEIAAYRTKFLGDEHKILPL